MERSLAGTQRKIVGAVRANKVAGHVAAPAAMAVWQIKRRRSMRVPTTVASGWGSRHRFGGVHAPLRPVYQDVLEASASPLYAAVDLCRRRRA